VNPRGPDQSGAAVALNAKSGRVINNQTGPPLARRFMSGGATAAGSRLAGPLSVWTGPPNNRHTVSKQGFGSEERKRTWALPRPATTATLKVKLLGRIGENPRVTVVWHDGRGVPVRDAGPIGPARARRRPEPIDEKTPDFSARKVSTLPLFQLCVSRQGKGTGDLFVQTRT